MASPFYTEPIHSVCYSIPITCVRSLALENRRETSAQKACGESNLARVTAYFKHNTFFFALVLCGKVYIFAALLLYAVQLPALAQSLYDLWNAPGTYGRRRENVNACRVCPPSMMMMMMMTIMVMMVQTKLLQIWFFSARSLFQRNCRFLFKPPWKSIALDVVDGCRDDAMCCAACALCLFLFSYHMK